MWSYSAFYSWAVHSPLCFSGGLPDVRTAPQRLVGHASSKLLPLKHVDEVGVGLCVASGCVALSGKTVRLCRSQEIYLIPLSVCRRNWCLKLEEGLERSGTSCILVISGWLMIGSIS